MRLPAYQRHLEKFDHTSDRCIIVLYFILLSRNIIFFTYLLTPSFPNKSRMVFLSACPKLYSSEQVSSSIF